MTNGLKELVGGQRETAQPSPEQNQSGEQQKEQPQPEPKQGGAPNKGRQHSSK
jgi:hypothetical protein